MNSTMEHGEPRDSGRPLAGRTVLVTRAGAQAAGLVRQIERSGGTVVELPTIEIQAPVDFAALDGAVAAIETYDWLILTSVNGVAPFLDRLHRAGKNLACLQALQVGAIGPETARRLEAAGVHASLVPARYQAEGILEAISPALMKGKRVLIPRAAEAREVLPETLRQWGAVVDVVVAYRTALPEVDVAPVRALLRQRKIHAITFTSSSTVRNFVALLGGGKLTDIAGGAVIACIGPITAQTVAEAGGHAAVVADEFTTAGLVHALAAYFRSRPRNSRAPGF